VRAPGVKSLRTIGSSAAPVGPAALNAHAVCPGVLTLVRPDGGHIELPAERSTTGSGNRQLDATVLGAALWCVVRSNRIALRVRKPLLCRGRAGSHRRRLAHSILAVLAGPDGFLDAGH